MIHHTLNSWILVSVPMYDFASGLSQVRVYCFWEGAFDGFGLALFGAAAGVVFCCRGLQFAQTSTWPTASQQPRQWVTIHFRCFLKNCFLQEQDYFASTLPYDCGMKGFWRPPGFNSRGPPCMSDRGRRGFSRVDVGGPCPFEPPGCVARQKFALDVMSHDHDYWVLKFGDRCARHNLMLVLYFKSCPRFTHIKGVCPCKKVITGQLFMRAS